MKFRLFLVTILVLTLIAIPVHAADGEESTSFKIGVEAGYFVITDEDFESVYDSGGLQFGLNTAYSLSNTLDVIAAFDFFTADGKTTVFMEDASININHLRLGLAYYLTQGDLRANLKGGGLVAMVSEESPFGDFSDSAFGFFIGAGFDYLLGERLAVGFDVIYSNASIEGDIEDEGVGGLSFLASLKYCL